MRAASEQSSSYLYRTSWRDRVIAFVLAVVAVAVLVVMLIRIGVLPVGPALQPAATMLDLREPPKLHPSPAPKTIKPKPSSKAKAAPPIQIHEVKPPKTPPVPWNVIPMTSEQFAASDISKMSAHGTSGKAAGAASQGDGEAGDGRGKGEGGGDEIYNVDWYVKPAHAVMASYMSRVTAKSGWGEVKCRMIDHYHVEDCQELDESPPGSGFSRALREAAWQFLVRPPSVNGKPLLGTWVRIHFDFFPSGGEGGGGSDDGGEGR